MDSLQERIRQLPIVDVARDVLPYEVVPIDSENGFYRSWCPWELDTGHKAFKPNLRILENSVVCMSCMKSAGPLTLPLLVDQFFNNGLFYLEWNLQFSRANGWEMREVWDAIVREADHFGISVTPRNEIDRISGALYIEYDEIIRGGQGRFLKAEQIDSGIGGMRFFCLGKEDNFRYYAATSQNYGKHIGKLGYYLAPPFYRVEQEKVGLSLMPIVNGTHEFLRLEKWVGKSSSRRIPGIGIDRVYAAFGLEMNDYV